MELPELPEGLVWRQKPNGGHYRYIYFKKRHRGRDLRGSSKTTDPAEAERRLRKLLDDIDKLEVYGLRPAHNFREGAEKMLREFQGSKRTLQMHAAQADILSPWIGDLPLPISKDDLWPFIAHRESEGVSARTINISIETVRKINRLAFRVWCDSKTRLSWTDNFPLIPFQKGDNKLPHVLSLEAQDIFFENLPGPERRAAIFAINTGLREGPICALRWDWEEENAHLGDTVFRIPGRTLGMKNRKDMTLVLNREARKIVDGQRGLHPELVFCGMKQITTKAWQKAWKASGLPTGKLVLKGVHNMRHTFATRLRNAGVEERDVQDLLHHVPKNITRHYSAPELRNLKKCVEKIVPKSKLVEVA